ncbi:Sialic acid transporter NanT [Streptomyces alboniger]
MTRTCTTEDASTTRRVVIASVAGNMMEWYDFFLYTTAATLVLGTVFFPSGGHPLLGTIAALAGHAVGFAARPIGGVIFGHIGDRRGRKAALMGTLSLMGVATFCMGLLPSYSTAGLLSPVLLVLLRLLQGAAAGGEWGGGVLIITENVPAERRGFLASFSSCGMGLGFVLSALALWLAEQVSGDGFLAWGWRLPFLASAVIFVVGLYIRRNLGETDSFETESTESEKATRSPLREVLRRHPRQVLFAMALRFADSGASYIFMSFSLVYGAYVGISSTVLLWAGITGMLVDSAMMVVFGLALRQGGQAPRLSGRGDRHAAVGGALLPPHGHGAVRRGVGGVHRRAHRHRRDDRRPALVLLRAVQHQHPVLRDGARPRAVVSDRRRSLAGGGDRAAGRHRSLPAGGTAHHGNGADHSGGAGLLRARAG